MPIDETLGAWGENIRAQREAHAPDGKPRTHGADETMSRRQLGALLDPPVNESTIGRWERGLMEPRRHHKIQLARILHLDVRVLFPLTRISA